MILHLCHQSSKILLKTLPEATGIFWLASKSRKFHVNADVKSLEESIALINLAQRGKNLIFLIFSNPNLKSHINLWNVIILKIIIKKAYLFSLP